MKNKKINIFAILAAVVIIVLIICTCRVTIIPDPVVETIIDADGNEVVVEEISFAEQDIRHQAPHKIVSMGLAHVPEGRRVFLSMSVEENLEMGAFTQPNSTIASGIADVYERFPRLKERRKQVAGTLSGGEQQMLAMGRALMSRPKLLMLDEPSMGLAPLLVQQIFDIIRELHAAGTTILLVEQNARMALSIADRGYVLETGNIVLEGSGEELIRSDAVKKAYLGG